VFKAERLSSFLQHAYCSKAFRICQALKFAYNREMTFSQFFNIQTKTIAFAAGLLVLSSLVSRALGIVRNGLLSWRFGAGETTDIYLAAFRIPDFIYGILIMGGISAVFLPMFSEHFHTSREEGWKFTSNVLNVLFLLLLVLSALAFLFAPFLVEFITPGFTTEQQETTASLTRLMLLSPLLLGVSSVFSGMLHYFGKFLAYSLAPILYNVGIIAGIVFLVPLFGIWGLGLGVVTGALLHSAVQVPAVLHSGFKWSPLFDWRDQAMKKMFLLALPRTIAAASLHVNLVVLTALASLIATGSITIFNYANDVQYFPIGLIGVSFAMAAFPSLSRSFAKKNIKDFQEAFATTFRQIFFFVMPVAILLFLLRAQSVRLVYGAGDKFTWDDTRLTAAALGIFAFGVLFQALIPFLARAFFATKDTKAPTVISLFSVAFNIVLAVFLIRTLAVPGALGDVLVALLKLEGIEDIRVLALPLALVISGMAQAILLGIFLAKYVREILQKDLYLSLAKTAVASVALGIVTYGILRLYGGVFFLTTYEEVLGQLLLASMGGILAFAACAFLVKSPEMLYFWKALKGKLYGR